MCIGNFFASAKKPRCREMNEKESVESATRTSITHIQTASEQSIFRTSHSIAVSVIFALSPVPLVRCFISCGSFFRLPTLSWLSDFMVFYQWANDRVRVCSIPFAIQSAPASVYCSMWHCFLIMFVCAVRLVHVRTWFIIKVRVSRLSNCSFPPLPHPYFLLC